jgi:hypothetical protein
MSTTKPATIVKARLRNFGNGILDVSDDTVKFYVETGRFRKHRETIRNIPIAEVESLERQENDLSLTWKENTDVFAIIETSKVLGIHERILAGLKERQKPAEATVTEAQKQTDKTNQLVLETATTIEVANALFNILRHLHGRVDWKLVELGHQQVDEAAVKLANLGPEFAFLDMKPISTAVQQRYPKEIAERTLEALKTLHRHFDGGDSAPPEGAEQPHFNRQDSRVIVQAFYVLNDLTLGAVVGDKDSEKEAAELRKLLEELAKQPGSKIDIDAVKASFEKLSLGRDKQKEGFEEINAMLELQRQDLMIVASSTQQTMPAPSQSA